jgi:hypothetical protein
MIHMKQRETVTVQRGSNAMHLTMTVLTGGLWGLVWLACRRKVRVTRHVENLPG